MNRVRNVWDRFLITSAEHPQKFTKNRNRQSNKTGLLQEFRFAARWACWALSRTAARTSTSASAVTFIALAHPWVTICFMSSIVSFGPRFCDRQPMKSAIVPFDAAAFTTIRPSGQFVGFNFLSGTDTKMFEQILLERNLSFPSNR
jgi:hypothetical protein